MVTPTIVFWALSARLVPGGIEKSILIQWRFVPGGVPHTVRFVNFCCVRQKESKGWELLFFGTKWRVQMHIYSPAPFSSNLSYNARFSAMPLRREILKQRGAEVAKQEISVSKQILSYEEIGCK